VLDHSDFRTNMRGRLLRTARFIGITTYGSTADAEAAIARVRRIHGVVTGVVPGGAPYSASDPDLLAWVHVAEVTSFLAAHVRYRDPAFSPCRQDAYHAEMAGLARRLGAHDVPETARGAASYLEAKQGELRVDARTRDVARLILTQPAPDGVAVPFQRLVLDAGVDLLPRWARRMHRLHPRLAARIATRTGAAGAARAVRWAVDTRVRGY
jgi:uncharacterized protein (DUF2236 family)